MQINSQYLVGQNVQPDLHTDKNSFVDIFPNGREGL